MQVLLRKSDSPQDIQCTICGQGFHLYWERTSSDERNTMHPVIAGKLRSHHAPEHGDDQTLNAHPADPFNLPEWSGQAQFSAAALLGGLPTARRMVPLPAK